MIDKISSNMLHVVVDSGALLEGHFELTSKRHSTCYFQCAKICSRPEYVRLLSKQAVEKIKSQKLEKHDLILTLAIGGIVFGYEMARHFSIPLVFVERNSQGIMELRRGFEIPKESKVLIVEDVITTGQSVIEAGKIVYENGSAVVGYVAIIDRSEGKFNPEQPLVALDTINIPSFEPSECPLCLSGNTNIIRPGSNKS